jgi:hypothetical protein
MDEEKWLTCADPDQLLSMLYDPVRVSYRKLRLFACACCRLLPDFMASQPDRESLEFAEREADGLVPPDAEFPDEEFDIRWYRRDPWNSAARAVTSFRDSLFDQHHLHQATVGESEEVLARGNWQLAEILREIVGNPFRPISADPAWLTSDVPALARGIYDERAFDRMPILADALQDAGCDNTDVLNHCRDANQIHVRGCWVVDLLLGKT